MTALARLTEEEAYLAAILMDPTGVDIAEFLWEDTEASPDGCYRLWPFQWPWSHSGEQYEIDAMARQLGKSFSVVWKAMGFVFQQPGQEMLVTAPELNHLELLTSKIEDAFNRYRLLDEMRPRTAARGIKKQPHWTMKCQNGATIMTRLPNRDGRGVKGTHPVVIELDEVQDYPTAGYTELIETIKTTAAGMTWRVHGVSKGVGRDLHYTLTQGKNEGHRFYVHHYIAAHRPGWTDEERQTKIAQYGGDESHPDYQRNVLGLPSDAGSTLFVTARLLACVRIRESEWAIEYNDDVYARIKVNDALVERVGAIESLIDLPICHLREEYRTYWAGADIGFTNDPTEILVFGSLKDGTDRLLARIRLERISAQDQVRVIKHVFEFYGLRLQRFGMDRTGNGLPLMQFLKDDRAIAERIVGYNFAEKRPVEFQDREPRQGEKPEDMVIVRNVKDYATDELRKMVDAKKLELPFDDELLKEWQGQTAYIVRTSKDDDGVKRSYGGGACHTLDGARMYAAAKTLMAIEKLLEKPAKAAPVLDRFF
jgi:hypothetical protein